MKNRGMLIMSAFYMVYFICLGISTFISKYFGEIGLDNAQIGVLTSVPSLAAMCFTPLVGAISDRARYKKFVVFGALILAAAAYFFVDPLTDFSLAVDPATGKLPAGATKFLPLLLLLTVMNIFTQPVNPTATSIGLEYTESIGKTFGPIRMMGTVGFQLGALIVGFICTVTLRYIYVYMGLSLMCAAMLALFLPSVEGHQHGGKKVPPRMVFKDKRVVLLFSLVLIGTTTSMYYNSFFGAYLGEMGVSNKIASVITWLSVMLEIPMLFFGAKIMKRCAIWKWLLIGYLLNGIRWLGLYFAGEMGSWQMVLGFQMLAVTVTSCFEFFPSLYIGKIIAPELSSSAQGFLSLVSFGVARVIGSLIGGVISKATGTGNMFMFCGILLLAAFAVLLLPLSKLAKNEPVR